MSKVLTIDDDRITHRFVRRTLESEFEILEAMNGEDGITIAGDNQPDIILLDVEMPGLNGYQVCDRLRQIPDFKATPIVFLSSHSSLRERLQGYECGGTDYLTKPFEPDTLLAKIKVIDDTVNERLKLELQAREAEKTAYTALSTSSDLGQVVHFAEQVAVLKSLDTVGAAMINTASSMGLNVVASITGVDGEHWYSSGTVLPLEKEVMTLLRHEQRINDFGARTVINYPFAAMMVKNMPLEDMDRYGRIKDIIPAMLSTANGRVEALNSTATLKQQTADMTTTLVGAHRLLSGLIDQGNKYRKEVDHVLDDMFHELMGKLPHMGLEEDQELYIVNRIDNSLIEVREIEEKAAENNAMIDRVINDIDNLVERQKEALHLMHEDINDESDDDDDEEDLQSVELF